jgi:hypothetical protein
MILAFKLTMPGSPSWNGKWSGEGRLYARTRTVTKKKGEEVLGGSDKKFFGYRWSDGWFASVEVEQVNSNEKRKLTKDSVGFASYDWMIDSILTHGKILAS